MALLFQKKNEFQGCLGAVCLKNLNTHRNNNNSNIVQRFSLNTIYSHTWKSERKGRQMALLKTLIFTALQAAQFMARSICYVLSSPILSTFPWINRFILESCQTPLFLSLPSTIDVCCWNELLLLAKGAASYSSNLRTFLLEWMQSFWLFWPISTVLTSNRGCVILRANFPSKSVRSMYYPLWAICGQVYKIWIRLGCGSL